MEKTKWTKIWESDEYKAEIYDNCSTRVYAHAEKNDKVKIEVDGTKWVGNSGGFHVYKYFVDGKNATTLKNIIDEFDDDERSEADVSNFVDSLTSEY